MYQYQYAVLLFILMVRAVTNAQLHYRQSIFLLGFGDDRIKAKQK